MKKTVILMTIIAVLTTGALLYIGTKTTKNNKPYKALEADLVEAAVGYVTNKELKLSLNETLHITSDTLLDEIYIKKMNVEDDECVGYVLAKKGPTNIDYKAYIKCGKYETVDYEKNK